MENTLIETGLSRLQAQAYLYLIENGLVQPVTLMEKLKITRTNTYKVLESLERLGLAGRKIHNNKAAYYPESPTALASLVAEKRNSVIALEKSVDKAMRGLQSKYIKHTTNIKAEVLEGKKSIKAAYTEQAQLRQPIYFVKSRADIPFMGFDSMDEIRKNQGRLSGSRYGITADSVEAPKDKSIDRNTNLERTWINQNDYTSPVEWSVSGNMLVIQVFDGQGQSIVIKSDAIAESFRQFWHIASRALKNSANYKDYPAKASRET